MSGFFRATGDLLITCDPGRGGCGYMGWAPAIEDYERMSLTWACPECDFEAEEDLGNDD